MNVLLEYKSLKSVIFTKDELLLFDNFPSRNLKDLITENTFRPLSKEEFELLLNKKDYLYFGKRIEEIYHENCF